MAPAPTVIAHAAVSATPLKLVYRNSVIPGGVHSAAELAAVAQRDPVVAAHYANFELSAAHLLRVEKSRLVHVSYRIGDKIYWTRKKVRLAAGESLLSDGKHLARTRCGNRIADEPQGQVLDNEPSTEALEASFVSSDGLIDQMVNTAAGAGGSTPAPAVTATAAAIVAQPAATGNLSSINSVFPVPAFWFPSASNPPDLSQPAPTLPADAIATAPAVVGRSDGSDTAQADPVPDGLQPQLPVSTVPPSLNTPVPAPAPQLVSTPTVQPTPVPEPGSAALAGLALCMLLLVRRNGLPGRRSR